MKLSKKVLLLIVAALLVISMFSGCGSQSSTTETTGDTTAKESSATKEEVKVYPENGLPMDQEITLKVGFQEQGYGREWYDNCVKIFTTKYPNVKFETQYSPTISEIAKVKLIAGNVEDMFDLFFYNWAEIASTGKIEPLEDILQRETLDTPGKKVVDVLVPGITDSLTYFEGKHLYNIPLTMYVGGLFFDQALFEENGWNMNPKTWSDFLKLCEDIKSKGIAPIAYAGMYDYEKFAFAPKKFELAQVNGKTDFRTKFRNYEYPFFTSPENLEVWKRVSELGKKGYIDPASVSINHTQSQMMAIQHKVAMVPSGSWVGNEMKDSTPESFKWAFMGVPFGEKESDKIYITNGISKDFCIYADKSEINKKWAKEFLLSLYSLDCQKQLVEKAGALSVRKDFLEDSARANGISYIQKSVLEYIKNNNVAMVGIEDYEFVPKHPDYQKAFKLFKDNNALMATGQKDPLEILTEADELLKVAVDAHKAENK